MGRHIREDYLGRKSRSGPEWSFCLPLYMIEVFIGTEAAGRVHAAENYRN